MPTSRHNNCASKRRINDAEAVDSELSGVGKPPPEIRALVPARYS